MKRWLFALCVVSYCLGAATSAPAAAKTTNTMLPRTAKSIVASWAGSWNCVSGNDRYREVFTPVLGGTAMQITSRRTLPGSASGIATFDQHRNRWFYSAITGAGGYFTMFGAVSGPTISFSQVAGNATTANLIVHRVSPTKFTSLFTAVVDGKKMRSPETCTK